jgi:hypothetical protein
MLQGFDLAPSFFLCRFHDTRLKPLHITLNGSPIGGVPLHRIAGNRTSL